MFGVNEEPLCFGTENSFQSLRDAVESPTSECPQKEINEVTAAIGNSGRLAVHQAVGEQSRTSIASMSTIDS